jgi:peptide/nickel transport system permease protein
VPKGRSPFWTFLSRLVRTKPLGTIGAVIVLLLFFTAIFADYLAPYDYTALSLRDRLAPPSAKHWLGADQLGRDVLSRIIQGARVSMIVGFGASFLNIIVATVIGIISGYFGGKIDLTLQRLVDGWMSIPGLLILMTLMSFVGRGNA